MKLKIRLVAALMLLGFGSGSAEAVSLTELSATQIETLNYLYERLGAGHPLAKVAFCESSLSHYEEDGVTVKRGKVDQRDTGLMQINLGYHAADAKRLGYDVFTREGNLQYAVHLTKTQGLRPWKASRPCFNSTTLPPAKQVRRLYAQRLSS